MKRGHPYIDVFGKGSITMEKAVQTSQRTDQELSSVQFLTITAAFVALTYIFTAFINVKLPIAAGGIGMGLFDLLSGWTLWAPFTLIIVGIMGFTVGKLTEDPRRQNMKWYVNAIAAACVIKVAGYYIAEVIIYGNPLAPVSSIPGNLVQIGVAAVIVLIVITPLNLAVRKTGLKK